MALRGLPAAAVLAGLCGGGCSLTDRPSGELMSMVGQPNPSSQLLRERLGQFELRFTSLVERAVDEIIRVETNPAIRKRALLWQLRANLTVQESLDRATSLDAFLDAWALCVQAREYLTTGAGREEFGAGQQHAVAAAETLLADIEGIGTTFLSQDQMQLARKDVTDFARENPIQLGLGRPALLTPSSGQRKPGTFAWIGQIGLAPFRAIDIGGAADAARDVAIAGDRFADVLEELPERTRWQSELLLLEIDQQESVQRALLGLEKVTERAGRLTALFERLPAELRGELTVALDDIDRRQYNLQATLAQADALVASLDPVLLRTETTVRSAKDLAEGMTAAADAWRATAESISDRFIVPFQDPPGVEPPQDGAAAGSGFNIKDWEATADALTRAADAVTRATAEAARVSEELLRLTEPERLKSSLDRIDASSEGLVDRVFLRAIQLLCCLFALLLIYRFVAPRLAGGKSRQ